MKDLSKFQFGVLIVCGIFIVIGVIIFTVGKFTTKVEVNLSVWGTVRKEVFFAMVEGSGLEKNSGISFNYTQKNKENFDIEFLEALAGGVGPDIFFLESDSILKHEQRVFIIPFKSYSEKTFKESFIEGAEIFLTDEGVMGLPVSADPLVMYWNRDMFNRAQLVRPPRLWDELYDIAPALSLKDSSLSIKKSAVALGEYLNVSNAFEIMSSLVMQAGDRISSRQGEKIVNLFGQSFGLSIPPAESALSFYVGFSNSLKPFYSWNRSLPRSKDYFIAGDLAIYFGPASELFEIQDKNPNLNFDVALLPQAQGGDKKIVYSKMEALALNKASNKLPDAFNAIKILSGEGAVSALSTARSLPPTRRDLLSKRPDRSHMEVFYESAIISKSWLIPDISKSNTVFKDMVESVTSGRHRPKEAILRAQNEFKILFKN